MGYSPLGGALQRRRYTFLLTEQARMLATQ